MHNLLVSDNKKVLSCLAIADGEEKENYLNLYMGFVEKVIDLRLIKEFEMTGGVEALSEMASHPNAEIF